MCRAAGHSLVELVKVVQGVSLVPPVLLSSCPCSGRAPKCAAGAAPPRMSSRAKGKSWYFRFGTENACQGIILDRLEYSCVRNYLQFGWQYVDMSTCDFLPFIYLYIVHIYERFTSSTNFLPSLLFLPLFPFPLFFPPSIRLHAPFCALPQHTGNGQALMRCIRLISCFIHRQQAHIYAGHVFLLPLGRLLPLPLLSLFRGIYCLPCHWFTPPAI